MGAYEGPTNFLNVGASPSLMLNFAREKSLRDQISGKDLVTFTRSSTGTYVGADGLIKTASADEPRFDHDPATGESLGLLIEESRTNLLPNSVDIGGSGWSFYNTNTVIDNAIIAPNGLLEGQKLVEGGGTTYYAVYDVVSGGNNTYTTSIFAKQAESDRHLYFENGAVRAAINLLTGTAFHGPHSYSPDWTNPILKIEPYPNGWYKCSLTGTASSNVTIVQSRFHVATLSGAANGIVYSGNSTSGVYLWGAQLEVGSFPTSYIPTSASAVTRQPDNAQITGTNFTDWYNASDGTIFTVSRLHSVTSTQNFTEIQIDDGTQSNRIFHYIAQSDAKAKFQSWGSDTLTPNTVIPGIDFKHSSSYNSQSYITCLDGQLSSEGNTGTQVSLTEAHLGYNHSNNYLNGHLKQLIYYPARISDIKLQQMTKVFS
jgi:hypothetical protein